MAGFGSRTEGASLHKGMEIRSSRKRMANEGEESELGGWNRLSDGGRVGRKVSQVFCTLFSKTDQTKTMQTKDLAILTSFDLETSNHHEHKFIGIKSCKITMKTKQE